MSAKILVVDDEPDFIEFVSFNLRMHGLAVLTANNGLEALFLARRALPELVILDVMMDGVDGYSVCEILRRQPSTRGIAILMVTAATGQIARLNGLVAGADDFLCKPFGPQELLRRVERQLERHAARLQRRLETSDG